MMKFFDIFLKKKVDSNWSKNFCHEKGICQFYDIMYIFEGIPWMSCVYKEHLRYYDFPPRETSWWGPADFSFVTSAYLKNIPQISRFLFPFLLCRTSRGILRFSSKTSREIQQIYLYCIQAVTKVQFANVFIMMNFMIVICTLNFSQEKY